MAQRMFFNAVNSIVTQLTIEESAIKLLERILEETTKFARDQVSMGRNPHRRTAARMRDAVEETKIILASEYWANTSIASLAERVHCSPGYLSRTFRKVSGFTLHSYQQQLRLRASLQLISESRFNGAAIAVQLGFANHSHFSDVFNTQFGITPTEFAKTFAKASLQSMYRVLDANERSKPREFG